MKVKHFFSSMLLVSSLANATSWLNEYKVDSLPNQKHNWQLQSNYNGAMVENGILEIDTTGANVRHHAYFIENIMAPNDNLTIEARVKHTELIGSAGCGIWFANGLNEEVLVFTATGGRLDNSGLIYSNPQSFDPKEFHVYRIVKTGNNIDVYVDGNVVISAVNIFNTASTRNWIAFGDGSTNGSCKGYWDFIRYSIN